MSDLTARSHWHVIALLCREWDQSASMFSIQEIIG